MKKFAALLLVLVMALSVSVTAFAEVEAVEDKTIAKIWTDETGNVDTGRLDKGEYPEVELKFEVIGKEAANYDNAEYDDLDKIPEINVYKALGSDEFVIQNADTIKGVGLFTYRVKEVVNPVAGAEYDENEYIVQILRTYVADETADGGYSTDIEITCEVSLASDTSVKVEAIVNKYTVSDLTIDKIVTGNLSNGEDKFYIYLTFTSELPVLTKITVPGQEPFMIDKANDSGVYTVEKKIEITGNTPAITVTGIPAGVEVTVEEAPCAPYTLEGYSVDGAASTTTAPTITADAEDVTVVITNEYDTAINTGVSLDSLPYIIIMLAVVGAGVVFFVKKRQNAMEID